MNNVTREGRVDFTKIRRVPAATRKLDDYLLVEGDVLFNATNSPELVGKTAYVHSLPEPAVFSNHFLRLRSDRTRADGRYLSLWLQKLFHERAFEGMCRQWVGQATVNRDQLLAQQIPLPSLPEQRRIAEVLGRAETLRTQRRQALAQLDALAESIFLSLLTDTASAPWAHPTIGEIATTMRTGPFGSQLLHSEFVESGVAVLGIDNVVQNKFVWARPRYITESKFSQLERYRVVAGDVLITIMGTCGRCAIVPDDVPVAINTKHLCCIRLDQSRCIPMYLQATLLRHPEVLYRLGVHERGAVMPGLNMQLIRDLEIPLPPLAVQRRFEAEMRSVSDQQQTMTESLEQLDALFASLQHRAFRGEL